MYILIDQLEAVEDQRTGNAKRHKLGDILFIAIAAGVAGADTWYEIVEYAHTHEAFFRKYLELPSGISLSRLGTSKNSLNWNLSGCLPVNGQIEILLVRADRNFAEQIEIDCEAAIEITAATAVEFQIGSRRLRNSNSAAA